MLEMKYVAPINSKFGCPNVFSYDFWHQYQYFIQTLFCSIYHTWYWDWKVVNLWKVKLVLYFMSFCNFSFQNKVHSVLHQDGAYDMSKEFSTYTKFYIYLISLIYNKNINPLFNFMTFRTRCKISWALNFY